MREVVRPSRAGSKKKKTKGRKKKLKPESHVAEESESAAMLVEGGLYTQPDEGPAVKAKAIIAGLDGSAPSKPLVVQTGTVTASSVWSSAKVVQWDALPFSFIGPGESAEVSLRRATILT